MAIYNKAKAIDNEIIYGRTSDVKKDINKLTKEDKDDRSTRIKEMVEQMIMSKGGIDINDLRNIAEQAHDVYKKRKNYQATTSSTSVSQINQNTILSTSVSQNHDAITVYIEEMKEVIERINKRIEDWRVTPIPSSLESYEELYDQAVSAKEAEEMRELIKRLDHTTNTKFKNL